MKNLKKHQLTWMFPNNCMKKNRLKRWCAFEWFNQCGVVVATPLWSKCEDETHTPKSGNLESSGTPTTSELDFRGQNTLPWGALYTIRNALKCRCRKWPRMSHLDIYSIGYGRKKPGSQTGSLTPDRKNSGIDSIPVCADGMQRTIGNLLKRATSLPQTSS
jgi:hypothetical protein